MLISLLKMQNIIICSVWLHCWNLILVLDMLVCLFLEIVLPAVKSWLDLYLMYFITHTNQPSQDFHTSSTITMWNFKCFCRSAFQQWEREAHSHALHMRLSCFAAWYLPFLSQRLRPLPGGHGAQDFHAFKSQKADSPKRCYLRPVEGWCLRAPFQCSASFWQV